VVLLSMLSSFYSSVIFEEVMLDDQIYEGRGKIPGAKVLEIEGSIVENMNRFGVFETQML
jgi:hypothetical protein